MHPGSKTKHVSKIMEGTKRQMALRPRSRVRRIPGKPAVGRGGSGGKNATPHNTPQKDQRELRMATVNVGTMSRRSREVVSMLAKRRVDVCCVQEVRFKGEGTRVYGSGEEKYKFFWSGDRVGQSGVGILVQEELVEQVMAVERINARLMMVKLIVNGKSLCIISAYAPQVGCRAEEKEDFWSQLHDVVQAIPAREDLFIGGDLNGHIGSDRHGFEDVMGSYGIGERNNEGHTILEFSLANDLKILNTCFQKPREKKITYKSGDAETQIDFLLMKKSENIWARDCKVIPGEACVPQHRLLCVDVIVKGWKGVAVKKTAKRIKQWKLKDEDVRQKFERGVSGRINQSGDWNQLKEAVMVTARQVCGETSGRKRQEERETWWWNDTTQRAIEAKKKAFKDWQRDKNEVARQCYRWRNKQAKKVVAKAKKKAWMEWSEDLEKPEGEQKLVRAARQMKKERQDVVGVRVIKDGEGAIRINESEVTERWRSYFEALLNEENPHELEEVGKVAGPTEDVTADEVTKAMKKMKNNKAPGPSGLTVDLLKATGRTGVAELTEVMKNFFESERMPEEWGGSHTVPIFKGKGDALECGQYRGIRLLEHGMKLAEKILESRLRNIVQVDDRQFGFMPGKSTIDAIYIVRQLQEKYSAKKKKLYHVFVDLEKAFDRVPRGAIRWALRRQGVPEQLVVLVMALYEGARSRVKSMAGLSEEFDIGVGVHQGSALSPLLFITVMEEATKECRRGGPWELLYADDLVITAESKEEMKERFEIWREGMERRGLKINLGKTKVMVTGREAAEKVKSGKFPCGCCGKGVGTNSILCKECGKWCHKKCAGVKNGRNLSKVKDFRCPACVRKEFKKKDEDEGGVETGGGRLECVDSFCYLGEVLDCEARVERAVRSRVAAAWRKWRELVTLLVNQGIPLKRRGGFYEACVRPVLMYGSETWALTVRLTNILIVCDARMLRNVAGVKWQDHLSNAEVTARCGVKDLVGQIRGQRLRWLGHVNRRNEDHPLKEVGRLEVPGRRPVGAPRKTWRKTVEEDMAHLGISEDSSEDRVVWRSLIRQ